VGLLQGLREVGIRAGRQAEVATRLARLAELHAKKPSLLGKLRAAGLMGVSADWP